MEEKTLSRGYSIVIVLTACAIIGFVAGLAGSYLLSQPIFRQAQVAKFKELDDSIQLLQEKTNEIDQQTRQGREELAKLKESLDELTGKASTWRFTASHVKKNLDTLDRSLSIRMTKLENRAAQLEETAKQLEQQLAAYAKTMTTCDNDQKEQIRQLKLRLAELENKIAQMPRTP